MTVSVNQNIYPANALNVKTAKKPEEVAKTSFKGVEPENEEDSSTMKKVALVTAGLALVALAGYGIHGYRANNARKALTEPLTALYGKCDKVVDTKTNVLQDLVKEIKAALEKAKKGGVPDDDTSVTSLKSKLEHIESVLSDRARSEARGACINLVDGKLFDVPYYITENYTKDEMTKMADAARKSLKSCEEASSKYKSLWSEYDNTRVDEHIKKYNDFISEMDSRLAQLAENSQIVLKDATDNANSVVGYFKTNFANLKSYDDAQNLKTRLESAVERLNKAAETETPEIKAARDEMTGCLAQLDGKMSEIFNALPSAVKNFKTRLENVSAAEASPSSFNEACSALKDLTALSDVPETFYNSWRKSLIDKINENHTKILENKTSFKSDELKTSYKQLDELHELFKGNETGKALPDAITLLKELVPDVYKPSFERFIELKAKPVSSLSDAEKFELSGLSSKISKISKAVKHDAKFVIRNGFVTIVDDVDKNIRIISSSGVNLELKDCYSKDGANCLNHTLLEYGDDASALASASDDELKALISEVEKVLTEEGFSEIRLNPFADPRFFKNAGFEFEYSVSTGKNFAKYLEDLDDLCAFESLFGRSFQDLKPQIDEIKDCKDSERCKKLILKFLDENIEHGLRENRKYCLYTMATQKVARMKKKIVSQ